MGFFDSDAFESITSRSVIPDDFSYSNEKGSKTLRISYNLPNFSLSTFYFNQNKEDYDSGVFCDAPIIEEKVVEIEVAKPKVVVNFTSKNFNQAWICDLTTKLISGYSSYNLNVNRWLYSEEPVVFDKSKHVLLEDHNKLLASKQKEIDDMSAIVQKKERRSGIPSIIQMESVSMTSIDGWLKVASQQELVSVFNKIDAKIETKYKIGARATIVGSPGADITVDQFGSVVKLDTEDGRSFVLKDGDDIEVPLYPD
jgi:hypothetical protein